MFLKKNSFLAKLPGHVLKSYQMKIFGKLVCVSVCLCVCVGDGGV